MKLSILEKPTTLQILVFILNQEKEVLATDITENIEGSSPTIYSSIKILLEEGFIQEEWATNPRRRIFSLTEKGKKVAKLLVQIEEILGG